MKLDPKIPSGPLAEKWTRYRNDVKLVSPARKPDFTVIVVGTGLAGAAAAASLAELGYNVRALLFSGQRAARALCRRAGRYQRG